MLISVFFCRGALLVHSLLDQLVQVELILGVAEVADDLAVGVFVAELFQLLFAEAEQHLFGALVAAIALVCDIPLVEDVGFKALQSQLHHILRRLARAEQLPAEEEDNTLYFDFESEEKDPDYRKVTAAFDEEAGVYTLTGKQLNKIFRSTNFNDMGSLRYLYKYIEKSGAVEKLKEMGLEEGDIIRIEGFDMEYWDE